MKTTTVPGLVGIDVIETARFKKLIAKSKAHQLEKIFTEAEISYCRSFKDSWVHFAGHFAAKEAASKALGAHVIPATQLEVRHDKNGAPEIWQVDKKFKKKLPLKISISHINTIAVAMAVS